VRTFHLAVLCLSLGACTTKPPDDTGSRPTSPDDTGPVDADGDGFRQGEDCDDDNPTVFPGALESCNGIDDDCDGDVDEDAVDPAPWFADVDGDGFGDPDSVTMACEPPSSHVADATDCDDADATVFPGADELCNGVDDDCDGDVDEDATDDAPTWYADADGDGYGVDGPTTTAQACAQPSGYEAEPGDCDDGDAAVFPGADELCNGVDDDCDELVDEDDALDASTWYADADGDSYGDPDSVTTACELPSGHVVDDQDCDDGDAAVHPGARELCNSVDDDCDGDVDEDAIDAPTWYADADGDGYGVDGPTTTVQACAQPSGHEAVSGDCDDGDAAIHPGASDACDGVDNDCDGAVDEGVADTDADGVADCFDGACTVSVPAAGSTPIDATCEGEPITIGDPWDVVLEWQWDRLSSPSYVGDCATTPKVGRLDDTTGDGVIDEDDVPSVLVTTLYGYIVLLEGDTGDELWSRSGMHYSGGTAVADIDGDGVNEIAAFDASSYPVLLSADGTLLWTATHAESNVNPMITAADLDADGVAELITDNMVLDGLTGTRIFGYSASSAVDFYGPSVADLDLDGFQEIVVGDRVYDHSGSRLWSSSRISGDYGHWSAIVEYDGDPEAEILMIGGGELALHEHDGMVITWARTSGADQVGPPCVADFDGDGVSEVAWGGQNSFQVHELDGTAVWSISSQDITGLAGCSAWDFDADGVFEILYADEEDFYILDGATGAELFREPTHYSYTGYEYPIVADVDLDGSAEILFSSNFYSGTWGSLNVLGHSSDGWPSTRSSWGLHDYAITNIDEDGTVPTSPEPSWSSHNLYRAQPSPVETGANLLVEVDDSCLSSCDASVATVGLAVQLLNEGGLDIADDVWLSVYDIDSGDLLASELFSGGLAGGSGSAGRELGLSAADIGASGLLLVADDDGTGVGVVDECDESDNELVWTPPACP
jgi:hypothetical protein